MYKDLPPEDVIVEVIKDEQASVTALRDHLRWTIGNLAEDDLFIFYYAGHGFHGTGGNQLSAYDTNPFNIAETSLHLRDDLLELLTQSPCRQALIFVDACADKIKAIAAARDVVSDLDVGEVEDFLNSGWYCGVFLSCSPSEKSYPSTALGHGIWTHFLLQALSGRAESALTQDRWLTDSGLRDFLRKEVPQYLTKATRVRGTQTPQAILIGSNTFEIRHVPRPPAAPANEALLGITVRNNSEYLEGVESGAISKLAGFNRTFHQVPTTHNAAAEQWCGRLLAELVAEEVQELYSQTRELLGIRRRDMEMAADAGGGSLDTAAFRYSIDTGQNPDDPAEYAIVRRLELRQGWATHRAAIEQLFDNEFERLVVDFDQMNDTFDELVEKLEDVQDEQGGSVTDDPRAKRVTYSRDRAVFTFDLKKKRLEISFGRASVLQLVDAAQQYQIGIERPSVLLPAPPR